MRQETEDRRQGTESLGRNIGWETKYKDVREGTKDIRQGREKRAEGRAEKL